MTREDLSQRLVHLVRGSSWNDGLQTITQIIFDKKLVGGAGMIRGGYKCVCFSEAPLPIIARQLLMGDAAPTRYLPFGVIVEKNWLFRQGGRPVIYQSEAEYDILPPCQQWRHVKYEPESDPPVDFTWEREWRLRTDVLKLEKGNCTFLFPDADWYHKFISIWHRHQSSTCQQYEEILGEVAWGYYEDFKWAREALAHYLPERKQD